ncbi:MAG: amino acid adenylation domain-containing protein [Clostridia bacterium]|nr:amino acid adenylation domain-containing protein [Clostridia bacterium]
MSDYRTLTELIIARKSEENKGITFILGDTEEVFVSYKQLYFTALGLLYDFQKAGFKRGDEVIFQIDDNQRFVYTFWACILGGMIPVPVTTGTNDEHKMKLFKIWGVLNNPRIIATADFLGKLDAFAEKNGLRGKMSIIKERAAFVDSLIQTENLGEIYCSSPEDIAFIQFSSGSTGDPKGVIITHSNVLANLYSVIKWVGIDSNDVGLNWMPLTHDMGLIGTHIKDVIACINQYNIQTTLFIRHPSLWMQKASEHKVTLLYSPNFGYKHFLKFYQPDENRKWDLSRVRLIYNGAEPISMDLCYEFLDKMSVYGLNRNAMFPVYGLAEGTIAVTFPNLEEKFKYHTLSRDSLKVGEKVVDIPKEDNKAVTFIDVGYPIYNCHVRICDEENYDLGENRIGYIQIKGGNVTSGYYNNKAATEQLITADGWLNTGDLGFMRDRRLVITGRAKDVIFIAGQNYYSHDIERVGECIDGIELGKIAATGVFNEKLKCDELILFVIFKSKVENFIPFVINLKRIINQKMGIEVSEVIPVKNIPKTTSGKVQRFKLRESYIKGEYDSIKHEIHTLMADEFSKRKIEAPKNVIEEKLVAIWSEVLNIKEIGTRDNFFELGGDSLRITQLISRIRDVFGVELDQSELFDNPEIEKLANAISNSNRTEENTFDKIVPISGKTGTLPLSFGQQRLWFLDRLNANSRQYNLYTALSFKGKLEKSILSKSLNAVIKRHKVLQASFIEENGNPVQVLNPDINITLEYIDLKSLPEKERDKKALVIATGEAMKPFDLERAPLLRGTLLCLDENEHILILVVHHIVFDGWSFGILLKELFACYEALLHNTGEELPELSIQYMDFAQWQIDRMQNNSINRQMNYWKSKLGGILPVLDIPTDKQRPAVQTYNGAKFTGIIPAEMVRELQSYARKENATLFMVLLAAFKVLLYRYSGQTDIIVGSPIANRNRKDIEGLIGFFTNNLVLRTSFSEKSSFGELLKEVKRVTLEAYSNQDVPFEKIVEELHIKRDMSRNPLFQVLFGLQNTPLPRMELSEINVSTIDIDGGYSRFDLALDLREAGEELAIDFEYNTDLFSSETITRMAGHYKQLLSAIIKNPGEELDRLEILTKKEKDTLLCKWNDTFQDNGDTRNWTELFEIQAEKTPESIAAVCGNSSLTYQELNEYSNQLAHYLSDHGVGQESIVGIYIDRSTEMLIALLGIHKAGAAYLPMDPIFPKERLAYMIDNSQTGIILTEKKLSASLPDNNAQIIGLDTEWDKISGYSTENPARKYDAKNLAYVIYTSGSTGKPKGVQIEQGALVNFLVSMAEKTEITRKDALLAVTTLSFDIAGLELYMPLITGASVVIAQRDEVTDGDRLIKMLSQHGITLMQATPATWRLLIESGWSGKNDLRILCGGEALPRDLANQLLDSCSILLNVYGPTETTIWSTIAAVEASEGAVHIGKPIANTQVYVLDKLMNPVPVGIPGELLIGGDGLARGYLHLPELTEEKFIPNPFNEKEGERLYRTGDLVKYRSDGNIEFVGRIDHQVKIRGFRIELGEIEILLNQNPSVKESVVVAKEMDSGEKFLAAYIVPSSQEGLEELGTEKLRKYLREKLPDYMIPAAFMVMDSFPLTPNGKIDRKTLPMPEGFRPQLGTNYAAPTSEIEKSLIAIWQDVLKLERIGVNDNFFDLGGHSLLLAQVRSKIGKVLNKEISMMELFKYPTVSTLARFISGEEDAQTEGSSAKKKKEKTGKTDIAVIGLSGRFPGAKNIEEFWTNLCNGIESISRFTDEQVMEEGVAPDVLKKPGYVKAWGALDDIDKFDAHFFGYNPREAEVLDPQQRIFLEESWKALEDAGYDSGKYNGLIGVYASVGMNTYAKNLWDDRSKGLANDYQIMTSNDKDFLATRVAYKMNLEGPGVTVQTACSSSLVAVHLACQSLISGECDMALAGGVSIRMPQKAGYLYQEGMILSPDGHCRAFDEQAKGTVGGNGAGVVVLKRLEDAVSDGDSISAVIKGTAINNDGALKMGYTAPSIDGQSKAIEEAQSKSGIAPDTITYIEAHGTGTPLGDPIEIEALTKVFSRKTDKKGYCAIGSVKTNVGHLDAASGVTGLIKTVLALRHKKIPPSLNFKSPNPKIDFKNTPFFVNNTLNEWKSENSPLRAGISSFGIGGTNAHAVLEEAPAVESSTCCNAQYLLVLSAKNDKALERLTVQFTDFLKRNKDSDLADIAYTLQIGRKEFECRRFLICTSIADAIDALEKRGEDSGRIFSSIEEQASSNSQTIHDDIGKYSLDELGNLWLNGAKLDWARLYEGQKRKRVSLPSYPFEGQSYWVKKTVPAETEKPNLKAMKRSELSEWFYTPVWKQSTEDLAYGSENGNEVLLVLLERNYFTDKFVKCLKDQKGEVIVAVSGEEYRKMDNKNYIINVGNYTHYDNMLKDMSGVGITPTKIVNLFGITEGDAAVESGEASGCGEKLFYSMLYLAQAIGSQGWSSMIRVKVVVNNLHKIVNEKTIYTEKSLHLGPCRVIPREYPNIKCSSIDLMLPEPDSIDEQDMLECLTLEVYSNSDEDMVAYRGLQRWTETYERIKLDEKENSAVKLKNNGVYLMTGGLGGIGLVLAEYLAQEMKAKLILVSRSEFPEQADWDNWIESHGKKNAVSRKIKKLKQYQSAGAEILVCQADVTNKNELENLRGQVESRFGRVDGIIHAAGNPGGGMIQFKKKENTEQVLAPKVQGTIEIYRAFEDCKLDFFMLCSSLNAITGGFGQIDYSAANAFLDAFAHAHDSRRGTRFISIDWDRWPGVGMAKGLGQVSDLQEEELHPILGKCISDSPEKIIYAGELSPDKDWVLSEHLVLGVPTIAGTTYLEMARAAFEDITGEVNAQISEVIFLNPLAVKTGESRDVFTVMNKNGGSFDFRIVSKPHGEEAETANWLLHVKGNIKASNERNNTVYNIQELKDRCNSRTVFASGEGQKLSEEFISFGGRWRSLKRFSLGSDEGLVEVEMSQDFNADLDNYKLHPALLDVATGALRLAGGGNFLPFSYERLIIKGVLEQKIYGHIRFKNGYGSLQEVITCDIDILSGNGTQLAEIRNFSMRLTGEAAAANIRSKTSGGSHESEYVSIGKLYEDSFKGKPGVMNEGIAAYEGKEAFKKIINGCFRPQVIVSTKDIKTAIEDANYLNQPNVKESLDEAAASRTLHPRPELENEYVPPKNEIEKKLAGIWEDTLSMERVGIHDEFFALGGDSLLLIQLHSKLKEAFETDIAVVDLYKYNTISLLSKYINNSSTSEEQPAFTEVNSRVNKQLEFMKQRRQQMQRRKGVEIDE